MKIAIVGTGISGLVTAWLLSRRHEITLLEADARIGGHTNTVDVELGGRRHRVDTGFIVYNERTYPNFCRILDRLGVATQPSDMSFSVRCERSGLEYATHSLDGLFARRRNALDPAFHRMLADVLRFGRQAKRLLREDGGREETLRDFLDARRFSESFVRHYVVPMGAAIWSADPSRFLDFPARSFMQFFENHGLLDPRENVRWRTIRGGSHSYVDAMTAGFRGRIRSDCPVQGLRRERDAVLLLLSDGLTARFDHVVLACHSDDALALLHDASEEERELLGAIRYQPNQVTLHTDASVMPTRRAAWASWNYRIPEAAQSAPALTYNMNRLQDIRSSEPLLVSLNSDDRIDPDKVLRRFHYRHPVYDGAALAAQQARATIDGVARTHFCGAYWGHGFHEDGVNSALAVCERFGEVL